MKEKYLKSIHKSQDGFLALTSVLILSGFFVILFVGMFFSATEELEKVSAEGNSIRALSLASSCTEIALNELKNSTGYNGDEIRQVEGDDCEIEPIEEEEGNIVIIITKGEFAEQTKRIETIADLSDHPEIEIIYRK